MRLLRAVCDRAWRPPGVHRAQRAAPRRRRRGSGRRAPEPGLRPRGRRPDRPCGPRAPDGDPDTVADRSRSPTDRCSSTGRSRLARTPRRAWTGRRIRPSCSSASLRPYKGLDLLAEAWPQVLGAHPEARLLVVGKVLDAAVRPELDRLRALPRVQIVDRYVSVARMLDSHAVAQVVVFPYRRHLAVRRADDRCGPRTSERHHAAGRPARAGPPTHLRGRRDRRDGLRRLPGR